MKVIPREARKQSFTQLQYRLIIGSILGDGGLVPTGGGKRFRLTISHSDRQKHYLFWKHSLLKEYVGTPPTFYEPTNAWTLRTLSSEEFTKLRTLFYRGKQKIVPNAIKKMIVNPFVLAVWYMDDGNIRREYGKVYGMILNSHSFSKDDNRKLSKWIEESHGIKSMLQRNHGRYRLYFGSNSWKRFNALIMPYVLPSMQYKLS